MTDTLTTENQTSDEERTGARRAGTAVANATQDAAEVVRKTAEKAGAKLPDAMASAQVAATQTQRRLDEMPNDALMLGTSFSIGFGAGLFFAGANRLLVLLAMVPAAAMAMTIFGRDKGTAASRSK